MVDFEHLEAIIEWMRAEMKAHQGRMIATMKASIGKADARIDQPGTNGSQN
jgi:hypothetical protein